LTVFDVTSIEPAGTAAGASEDSLGAQFDSNMGAGRVSGADMDSTGTAASGAAEVVRTS